MCLQFKKRKKKLGIFLFLFEIKLEFMFDVRQVWFDDCNLNQNWTNRILFCMVWFQFLDAWSNGFIGLTQNPAQILLDRSHGQQSRFQEFNPPFFYLHSRTWHQDEQANLIKLRARPRSPQHRRLPPLRFHSTTSRQASFVTIQSSINLFYQSICVYCYLESSIDWLHILCRRDLLDISPTLTEAAGAIVDVNVLFLLSSFLILPWFLMFLLLFVRIDSSIY